MHVTADDSDSDQGEIGALPTSLDEVIPIEHWCNVGRVAVHAAWLEEAAALIRYAEGGDWDMSYNHLRFASSKQGLLRALRRLAKELPDDETRTLVRATGETITERGMVKRRLSAFVEDAKVLLDRRDRVVHGVPWQDFFSGEVQAIHPRSLTEGAADASSPLPTTADCDSLVRDLRDAVVEAQWLAPRVGGLLAGR